MSKRFPVELDQKSSGLKDNDKLLLGDVDNSNYAVFIVLSVLRAYMNFVDTEETTSTDGEIPLFGGTTGKKLKRSQKTITQTLGSDHSTVPTSKAVKDVTDLKANTADVYSKTEADAIFISKADNDNVVDLTSDQSITGEKTFVNGANIGNVSNDEIQQLNGVTSNVQSQLNAKIETSEKGSALGVAELDGTGKVPSAQLPSFVDDVIEVADFASLPVTGESGKIYVTLDNNLTYRWSGSIYVEISQSLALGETSTTAYRGDRGKTAYDHSQTSGNPHGTAKEDIAGLQTDDNPEFADVIINGLTAGNVIDDESVENSLEAIDENLAYKSAGCITMFPFTDNGDGTITTVAHDVALYDNATFDGVPKKYTLAGNTFTLVDQATNYIVADYNGGSPIQKLISDVSLITESSVTPMYTIIRTGTVLHHIDWDTLGKGLANKVHQSIVKTQRYRRESGLSLSEYGTRNIQLTAGKVWIGANPVVLDQILSATDNIRFYKHVASVWTIDTSITQYNNTQYDNGTDLVTLTNNRYAVNWLYRGVENPKHLYMFLGQGDYTLSDAQLSQPPSNLPATVTAHAVLVGRIIVLKSASTATQINSAFDTTFNQASVTDHNNLSNLQGGQANEYYHLTADQLADLSARVTHNLLDNSNFINASSNGYGKIPDNWLQSGGNNAIQGGYPSLTKQELIDILGVNDGDIELLVNCNGDFNDLSSNAYNLTGSGSPTDDSDGLMASAKTLNGTSQYATGNATNAKLTTDFTMIAIHKPTSVSGTRRVCGFAQSDTTGLMGLHQDVSGQLACAMTGCTFTSSGSTRSLTQVIPTTSNWYFHAMTHTVSSKTVKQFVNGQIAQNEVYTGTFTQGSSNNFSIGRAGDFNAQLFAGSVQSVIVLSVALSEAQLKKLWAYTTYRKVKTRRSGSNCLLYASYDNSTAQLNPALSERLRGKTVTFKANIYQTVASSFRLGISIGSDTTSAYSTTINAWTDVSVTLTIPSAINPASLALYLQNTVDGIVWVRDVMLYEGKTAISSWIPSQNDWSRFPRLLRMDVPKESKAYQYEEGRFYSYSSTLTGFSATSGVAMKFSHKDKTMTILATQLAGTSNATTFTFTIPISVASGSLLFSTPTNVQDNSANQSVLGHLEYLASSNVVKAYKTFYAGAWTASGGKNVYLPPLVIDID